MEPSFFLSSEETEILTGFKSPARQVQWLRAKGWRFEVNGNRRAIIARKYAEKMLGCGVSEEIPYKPNFAALGV